MLNSLAEFLKNDATLGIMSAGLILTFCYYICYCMLWKDIVRPRWHKRKSRKSLEIHPLYRKGIDSPNDQEWHVSALVMTSNDRKFLTEFFLENTKRVDEALERPIVSPYVKPGSTVIGYKLLPSHPDGLQNRNGLIPEYGKEHRCPCSWELAISKPSEDWRTCLEDTEDGVLTGKYGDFLPAVPSAKKLRDQKKSFVKEWKGRCSGKSSE